MLDETTDIRAVEQVSVWICVVKSDFKICEYFFGFHNTNRTDAKSLFNIVHACLTEYKLDIKKCRGKAYYGANVMSSRVTELQERVKQIEPSAFFVHCNAHRLNLVVQKVCIKNISIVNSFTTTIRQLITFVKSSAKRLSIFNFVSSSMIIDDTDIDDYDDGNDNDKNRGTSTVPLCSLNSKSGLRPFCPTRWAYAYFVFKINSSSIG